MLRQILLVTLCTTVACSPDDTPKTNDVIEAGDDDASADVDVSELGDDTADVDADAETPSLDPLHQHCDEHVGEARVIEVAPDLFVAVGFDLANTILLRTDTGNVVIDVSMSPARAAEVKAALDAVAPGRVAAIIYTHSHIDHVGGASVWVEEGTEIWSTAALLEGFLHQYGAFRAAESLRGRRQFAQDVDADAMPCNAIGARADLALASAVGFVPPTHTFANNHTLTVGGVELQLLSLPGETADQLGVYIPSLGALLPGDNFYAAFPNLYSIRGTRPRSVSAWVQSLDTMRSLEPQILVPSHTLPVVGAETVQSALRDYRDAIAWLQAEVTRGANKLETIEALAASIRLPDHLASTVWLQERYGQVDWSVRAIYSQELGWFDGRAETLYPPTDLRRREIELMGGADAVEAEAQRALAAGDARWAAHLLGSLRDAGLRDEDTIAGDLAQTFREIAASVANANGRGYLLQRALELEGGVAELPVPEVNDGLIDALPPSLIFEQMAVRLKPDEARDVEESLRIELTDIGETWTITVRRGVAEVREGTPLPGTPAPVATIQTTSRVWVSLALDVLDPAAALVAGELEVDNLGGVLAFLNRFESGV